MRKETPILFSVPMVRAILDGRKTQTRRVVKPQPPEWVAFARQDQFQPGTWWFDDNLKGRTGRETLARKCPKPGDLLYVRESFWQIPNSNTFAYAADGYPDEWNKGDAIKRPSIHMPKNITRLWLEVVSVWVERLQEIKAGDCRKEGVEYRGGYYLGGTHPVKGTLQCWPTPKMAFERIWQEVNGKKHPWESNPWVWVIEFKMVEKAVGV